MGGPMPMFEEPATLRPIETGMSAGVERGVLSSRMEGSIDLISGGLRTTDEAGDSSLSRSLLEKMRSLDSMPDEVVESIRGRLLGLMARSAKAPGAS